MALITELDDRTLVEQHRAGDPDAFRRIVSRHHRSLYSNALRRLGDPNAAEDAVQDAFLRAFRNIERFDGDYHLDAWLHRIVTNTCHDIGRRRGRDSRLFDRACTEVDVDVPPADEAIEAAVPVAEINQALDALPESYREVLVLRFVDELSYADVAEQAGISEENARARVSRGRNMLKRMLTSTSALIVWAIPPLRRQGQLGGGTSSEVANQAAAQVHGLATIATTAPAPTSAFTQVSGIIAQAGPAIATAAPAVSTSAPTFKAAVAMGIAATVAIPAGVAVDRGSREAGRPDRRRGPGPLVGRRRRRSRHRGASDLDVGGTRPVGAGSRRHRVGRWLGHRGRQRGDHLGCDVPVHGSDPRVDVDHRDHRPVGWRAAGPGADDDAHHGAGSVERAAASSARTGCRAPGPAVCVGHRRPRRGRDGDHRPAQA